MTLLDTNVIVDLFGAAEDGAAIWSGRQYEDALRSGPIGCNLIVLAELAAKASPEQILDRLMDFQIEIVDLSIEAGFLAGQAFADYRQRGGSRSTILPDFLIAGHAAAMDAALVTRDRRLASYFPSLALITPETHPHG